MAETCSDAHVLMCVFKECSWLKYIAKNNVYITHEYFMPTGLCILEAIFFVQTETEVISNI